MDNLQTHKHRIARLVSRANELELSSNARRRLQWFEYYLTHDCNVSLTCRYFGIARSTFMRWASRFDPKDETSLEEFSRAPKHVRQPEVPAQVITLIQSYRERSPHMSKVAIAEALLREHGVHSSSATVGRTIRRYGLYFAQTASHAQKRREATFTLPAGESANAPESATNARKEDGLGGLNIGSVASLFLVACTAVLSSVLGAPSAHASESDSYVLYDEYPNYADRSAYESDTFQMNEAGTTWTALPLEGSTKQIVTAPPQAASSAASQAASSAASTTPPAPGGGRGDRGDPGPGVDDEVPEPEPEHPAPEPEEETPETPVPEDEEPVVAPETPLAQDPAQPWLAIITRDQFVSTLHRRPVAKLEYFDAVDEFVRPAPPPQERIVPVTYLPAKQILLALLGFQLAVFTVFLTLHLKLKSLYGVVSKSIAMFEWFEGMLSVPFFLYSNPFGSQANLKANAKAKGRKARSVISTCIIALLAFSLLYPLPAIAETTVPQKMVYNGHLLSSSGTPITTAHSVRFSYWFSTDKIAGDVTATGSINIGASNYADWFEVHTVTPNSDGYFTVELGSGTTLPDFSTYTPAQLQSLFLQVEVKESSAANTSYELLDRDASNDAVDRAAVLSVPFAQNAEYIDRREVGTGSGNIAILGPSGTFVPARIPGGTASGRFVIDTDSTESLSINLQFGQSLSETLTYDISNTRFTFSDDVRIEGDLTVTGLINGVDISGLAGDDGKLKASSGAGLTINIAGGSYRINGDVTNYAGAAGVAITNQATNYVFFSSGGLTVSTIGFPTDDSAIRIATVTATGGAITALADRRITVSDDREQSVEQYLHAEYPNAVYQGDATNNIGQLQTTHDSISLRNYYLWTSSQSTLQDYDVIVRITLPSTFVRWKADPLNIAYRSTSVDNTKNKLDISVFDTNGTPVTLNGSSTDLASASWTSTTLNFTGSSTWTAGQEFLIKLKLSAKDDFQMHLGSLKLQFEELNPL